MSLNSSRWFEGTGGFNSNLTMASLVVREGIYEALQDAGSVVKEAARRKALAGMTTGDWVTETLHDRIFMTFEGGMDPVVRIGTDSDYGAYWELGHDNIFTRRFEKNRWLFFAFAKNYGDIIDEFTQTFQHHLALKHAAVSRSITKARSFIYATGKFLSDINSVIPLGPYNHLRSYLYRSGRLLGDVNSWRKGAIGPRVGRRLVGRVTGSMVMQRGRVTDMTAPQRLVRRWAGARLGPMVASPQRAAQQARQAYSRVPK